MRSARRRLTGPRMAAAGVRPESAGVVLVGRATLQEQLAAPVDEEYRYRAMQAPGAMGVELRRMTDLPVILVNENQIVGIHSPTTLLFRPGVRQMGSGVGDGNTKLGKRLS